MNSQTTTENFTSRSTITIKYAVIISIGILVAASSMGEAYVTFLPGAEAANCDVCRKNSDCESCRGHLYESSTMEKLCEVSDADEQE